MLRRALFASIIPGIALVASCMGPTEIVVDITTNACTTLQFTDVWVDGKHVTQAPTPACDPNNPLAVVDVGTITLLPSHGIGSDVSIALVGNLGDSCSTPDTTDQQCIVARRALAFNPHQRLDLPILLDNACAGLNCKEGQTCVVDASGRHCSDSTCGKGDAPSCVVDAGLDAITSDVIVIDAGPPLCPLIVPPIKGTPTFSWTFDTVFTDGVHEANEAFQPPPPFTGAGIVPDAPTFCDNTYLRSKSTQTLASAGGNTKFGKFATKSFIAGFAFNTPSSDAPLLALVGSSTQPSGFDIQLVGNALQVSFGGNVVYTTATPLKTGWRRFAIEVVTIASGTGTDQSTLTAYVDGVAQVPLITPTAYPSVVPVAFSVGPIDVDSVTFYSK